jgi:hypothetical protein
MRLKCLRLRLIACNSLKILCAPVPCFGPGTYPVRSRGVVLESIDGLKSAVGPFGLDHPLITVTQYQMKDRFSCRHVHLNNIAGVCDGQKARLWNGIDNCPRPRSQTEVA